MHAFTPSQISRVRDAVPIAAVVGQYVKLRPGGADSLKGPCCFHQETQPSMVVHPAAGYYHCFGCGAGGGAVDFLMKAESLPFPVALRRLANDYGVSLEDKPVSKAHYQMAVALAAEADWWIGRVRLRYHRRLTLLIGMLTHYSDLSDGQNWEEEMYQRYARRAWRFGKRVRKMDALTNPEVVKAYTRKRTAKVREEYRQSAMFDQMVAIRWSEILSAIRAGKVSEQVVWRITAILYAAWGGLDNPTLRAEILAGQHDSGRFKAEIGRMA